MALKLATTFPIFTPPLDPNPNPLPSTELRFSRLNTANDSFKSYSFNENNPKNSFKSYGTGSVSDSNIRDKMAERSFLPLCSISLKLPFSSLSLGEMKEVFHAREGSANERVVINVVEECERAPSDGETKRCVGSAEGMIEFVVSVLGSRINPRLQRRL